MLKSERRGTRSRRVAGVIAVAASIVGLSLVGTSSASAADRSFYEGSVPSWATSANDVGVAAVDTSIEGELYLPLRDPNGAANFANAVSTPGSTIYKQFLTPAQWIAKYSPTKASSDALVAELVKRGFTITAVPDSRLFVLFRGTAAQINDLFNTSLHTYDVQGRSIVGPSTVPSVPAALAPMVSGISIDQSRVKLTRPNLVKPGDIPASAAGVESNARQAQATPVINAPCSNYYGQNTVTAPVAYGQTSFSTNICGYTPRQMRSAYGLDAKVNTGAGQTVAIIDAYASPSIVQDVNTYSAQLGEPTLAQNLYSQIVPTPAQFTDQEACGFPSGWQGEQTLDVEAVHAIAPQAKILYVGGTNCGGGIDVALSKIIDGTLANIVSNSYGYIGEALPADVLRGVVNQHIEAAGVGVGLYYSSGDNGDEVANLGYASPDFSASSPFATSVGGTSIAVDKNGALLFETGWGTTLDKVVSTNGKLSYTSPPPGDIFAGGAGGGTSAFFGQPAYQKGTVPTKLAKGYRVSPDISALADPYTGFLIGIRPIVNDDTLAVGPFEKETYGGTSLASPLAAAQVALIQQATNTTIGFANPLFYSLNKADKSLFRDVVPQNPNKALIYTSATSGNTYLVSLDKDSSLKTAVGYDNVTGIGGLNVNKIIAYAAGK